MADNGKPASSESTYLHTIQILQARVRVLEQQIENKVLFGKDEIMEAYKMTDYKFKKWIKMGMPVLVLDGTCYAHRDNIEEFFKAVTRVNSKNAEVE
jgi:predicted thioredoxin/glutaredoxin